jgi:hypothetical protein
LAEGSVHQHFGTAAYGDRPKDIRARGFALIFLSTLNRDLRNGLIRENAVVFRARFTCSQACRRDLEKEAAARGEEYIPKGEYRQLLSLISIQRV